MNLKYFNSIVEPVAKSNPLEELIKKAADQGVNLDDYLRTIKDPTSLFSEEVISAKPKLVKKSKTLVKNVGKEWEPIIANAQAQGMSVEEYLQVLKDNGLGDFTELWNSAKMGKTTTQAAPVKATKSKKKTSKSKEPISDTWGVLKSEAEATGMSIEEYIQVLKDNDLM